MNNIQHIQIISRETAIQEKQITAVVDLLSQDATIPFIARYRKEITGSLDEVSIAGIRNRLYQLQERDNRKYSILKSLEKQGGTTVIGSFFCGG